MKIIFKATFSLLIVLATYKSFGQEYSNNSLFLGTSLNTFSIHNGFGRHVVIGSQKDIINNRFRIEPSFSMGVYGSAFVSPSRDMYYSTTNLKCNFVADIIKIKNFSVMIGLGGLGNYTRGYDAGYSANDSSAMGDFFNFDLALNALFGFRYNPLNKRFAYELLLGEGSIGVERKNRKQYREGSLFQFRLIFKLKK